MVVMHTVKSGVGGSIEQLHKTGSLPMSAFGEADARGRRSPRPKAASKQGEGKSPRRAEESEAPASAAAGGATGAAAAAAVQQSPPDAKAHKTHRFPWSKKL